MSDPRVAILVPRRAGIEDRDRLWEFARTWWANDFPDWPIVEGNHEFGPFNRAAALNAASLAAGEWDVAVLIDADVLADRDAVRAAVDVASATNRMVLAYHERIQLTPKATERVLGGFTGSWRSAGMVHKINTDACSSAVAVSRPLWDDVGGFDELFNGWGWEDVGFRVACETLSGRPMVKLASTIFHLWHRISHENNARQETFQANKARGERYRAAHWKPDEVRALIAESIATPPEPVTLQPARIPRILHRTVPERTTEQVEHWWTHFQQLHPGWDFRTHREPLNPDDWPLTADLWDRCQNGAQKAGLLRLEMLVTHGGFYVDADTMPVRSFEPLLTCSAVAAWEDETTVPDAIMGAEPNHPAFVMALEKARSTLQGGGDAWHTGPGVTTEVLPGRSDVLLLPPGAFFPHHYLQKNKTDANDGPWVFCRHMWAGSWLTKAHKDSIQRRQRP